MPASARQQPQQLPPMQTSDMGADQYYPQSASAQLSAVFNREAKSPRHSQTAHMSLQQPAGKGPVPRFQKVKAGQDLRPKVNTQPPFRRANPEGGFISVRSCSWHINYHKTDVAFCSPCKLLRHTYLQPTGSAIPSSSTNRPGTPGGF